MAKSRTTKAAIVRALGSAKLPIYIVGENFRISYCNQATCLWLGQDEEFLTSLTCQYHSGVDLTPSQQLASGLCPPPEAFDGAVVVGHVSHSAAEAVQFRESTFFPLCDENHSRGAVMVVVHGKSVLSPASTESSLHRQLSSLHAQVAQIQYETASLLNLNMIVGSSNDSQRARRQIDLAATSGANVLIEGPKGSGRRQIAELIHYAKGPLTVGPLIPIEGALSDAEIVQETIKDLYRNHKDHPDEPLGRLLLLDVDRMSEAAQMEVVGFLKLPDFQLPLMATTTRGGHERINESLYREAAVITIEIPSLKNRRQDIGMLAQAIVEENNLRCDRQLSAFSQSALDMLTDYSWPGEIAELKEVIQFAAQATNSAIIEVDHLPQHLRIASRMNQHDQTFETTIDLDAFLIDIEVELIRRAISHSEGNKSRAAKMLGISRARLLRRLGTHENLNEKLDDKFNGQEPPLAADEYLATGQDEGESSD